MSENINPVSLLAMSNRPIESIMQKLCESAAKQGKVRIELNRLDYSSHNWERILNYFNQPGFRCFNKDATILSVSWTMET